MKKLMIAAFAIAIAAVTQAATVTWGANKGYLYDGKTEQKVTSGSAYLMFVTDTFTQTNLISAFSDANGDVATTLAAMQSSGAMATGAGDIGANARIAGVSTYSQNADANVYFVVFANDKMYVSIDATASYDPVGQESVATFNSITASSKLDFVAADGNQGAGWYNVPEPTSGLLLLLGMAGLALKRKVA